MSYARAWGDNIAQWWDALVRGFEGWRADMLAPFPIIYDAPLSWDDVNAFFAAPIIVAVAVAFATWAVPTSRWHRQLKRDLEIFASMPEGSEKEYWSQQVTARSARLREYRELVPRYEKVYGWGTVALVVFAVFATLVFGIRFDGPADFVLLLFGLFGVWTAVNIIRGRTFMGLKARDRPGYIESERRRYRRAEQRRKAAKRLRRIRKAEANAEPPVKPPTST